MVWLGATDTQLREKSASFDIDDKTYDGEKNHACQPPTGTADNPYMTRSGREARPPDRYGHE